MALDQREGDRMVTDRSNVRPPQWAESLLRLLLKPEDRESVSGDLLEEYREAIVPALGSAADGWYLRQVGWFLVRASWPWGALVGAALIIRYLFDTLVPVTDYVMRSRVLSYTVMAVCLLASFRIAVRTRSVRAGMLIALAAGAIGGLVSIAGTGIMLAFWHDPATLNAWRQSGGLDEAFVVVPLIMVAVGAVMGTAGAVLGASVAWPLTRMKRRPRT
jgi:hypothetical protein